MKVLHLLKTDRFSGAENVVCNIISMFKGHSDYEMIYCSVDGLIRDSLEKRGVPFLPMKEFSLAEVKRAVSEYRPDVIHAHDAHASLYAVRAGGIPVVSQIHGNDYQMRKVGKKSLAFFYAGLKAKKIIWVYEGALSGFVFSNDKRIRQKSVVLNNVLNRDELISRAKENVFKGNADIIVLGRLNAVKDPLRALRIIEKAVAIKNDITAVFVGDGELREDCQRYIDEHSLGENVRLLGFMDNPMPVISGSKLFLMTSECEVVPLAAMEAMAFGLPLILTPAEGMRTDATVFPTGIRFGYISDDDGELAQHIVELCTDEALLKGLSDAARARFGEMNDIDSYRNKLNDIYRQAL